MKHVAFIIGSYYPDFSAVGYCAYQVQKYLVDDFRISVVSLRNDLAQPLDETLGQIEIHRVETRHLKRRNALMKGTGVRARGLLFLLRIWGAVKRLLSPETIDRALVDAYLNQLNGMEQKPDAIVPLVFPFESVVAALAYKKDNPDVAVYPYLFDDFVESGSLHVLAIARIFKQRRHLRLERKMLEEADAVLSMNPLREHFERHFETSLLEKILYQEHPLLTRPARTGPAPDDRVTKMCFTGSLTKKVREPDYLLCLLRASRAGVFIRADFYVMGNDADKVKNEKLDDAIEIVNHGRVPKPVADDAVSDAHILLNLGEVRGKQISSKIFEYMSTGKPIVHLAYVKNDAVSKILEKYPLALCLEQDRGRFEENVSLLSEFIDKHRSSRLAFAEVEALYPEALPSVTASIIKHLVRANTFAAFRPDHISDRSYLQEIEHQR